jgi:hypothetical protein
VVRAADGHDPGVVRDEHFGDPICPEGSDDCRDVTVGAGLVVSKEPNGQGDPQVIVQEAREKGVCLVPADMLLPSPFGVVPSEPEGVVVA